MIRIIPSLLLYKKKLVKGKKFKNFKNAGSPVSTISALENQKADEISLIDLESYKLVKMPDLKTLNKIAEISSTPLTFGGGINTLNKARNVLSAGADKIFLNSVLYKNKKIIEKIAYIYGSQSIVGGLNIINNFDKYYLMEDKLKKIDPIEHIKELELSGVGEIKVIFVNSEGAKKGLDIHYAKKILNNTKVPVIFEGGIGNLEHLIECIKAGIKSLSIGTIITFNDNNIIKIKQYIKNAGFEVRI